MTGGPDYAEGSFPPGYGQPWPGPPASGAPGYGTPPFSQQPPTHLIWARIAAVGGVLFNLILGLPSALIAMRHARLVRVHWEAGNQAAAVSESRKARTWSIVATVFDALGIVLLVILIGASGSASNFNNPAVVAASIKTDLQKRISDPGSQYYVPGLKVTSVTCKSVGTNTDSCVDYFSNGQTASETAVISDNGQSYETH
jgi:Interferon-induced transmembrane protein